MQGRVGLDDVLDDAGHPAVVGGERSTEGTDDAGRDRAHEAERAADGHDELSGTEPVGVAQRRGHQVMRVSAEQGQVRERVGTHARPVQGPSIR